MRIDHMSRFDVSEIMALERTVWDALVSGDSNADEDMLDEDFLGVYETGFAGRQEHAGQLANGPTIDTYVLSDARLITLCGSIVLLAYVADYIRPGIGKRPKKYVTSIWKLSDGTWRNLFSQDTEAA
jgi:hypothetical protein